MRRVCGAPGDTWLPVLAGERQPCGGAYDDAERMTICPHVSLDGGDTVGVRPNPAAVSAEWGGPA